AVAVRIGRCPDVHLHARVLAVRRRGEVGVVGARAVLGLGLDVVTAQAAVAVVVLLEVAARLVEAELIGHVVDDVVEVEQVGHRGRAIGRRRLGQIEREVEDEAATAVRAAAGVGRVVGVGVGVGMGVVALGGRELGTGGTVGVVPAERRRRGVLRV